MRHPHNLLIGSGLLAGAILFTLSVYGPLQAQQGKQRPGEINTPPAKGERPPDQLKVGDPASDFTLADPTGKKLVRLSSYQGKKPVVLIFGSHT